MGDHLAISGGLNPLKTDVLREPPGLSGGPGPLGPHLNSTTECNPPSGDLQRTTHFFRNSAVFCCTVLYIHVHFTVSLQNFNCMFSFRAASFNKFELSLILNCYRCVLFVCAVYHPPRLLYTAATAACLIDYIEASVAEIQRDHP